MKDAHKITLVTSDTIVKAGLGAVRTVTFSCNDAAPTAGTIDIYDGVAVTGGTKIFSHTFTTTPFVPFSVALNAEVTKGIFVDFTTTNDVNVSVTYS